MNKADYQSIKRVVEELLTMERLGNEAIIRLPLIMPDGSNATVRVLQNGDQVFVGDMGLAYNRAESLGASYVGFANTAKAVMERYSLERNKSELFARVSTEELYRAVCEVGMASWQVADTIAGRSEERVAAEFSEQIGERLVRYFGADKVDLGDKIVGQSQTSWDVTAIVKTGRRPTIFQAVTPAPINVYRTKAAFHDISILEDPPKLVAVVKSKDELGNRLALLSQEAYVIEEGMSEASYRKVAA